MKVLQESLPFSLRAFLFFALSVLLSSSAWANPLALDAVYQSLEQSYPLILGSQQDIEKSLGDNLSAKGGFDPILKSYTQNIASGYYKSTYYDISLEQPIPIWGTRLITGFKKGTGNIAVYDSRNRTFDQGEWRAGIEIPLLKGGWTDERRTRIQASELNIQNSKQNLASKQLETRREAAKKYWDWVAAGRKLSVAKELLEIAITRDHAILTRVQHGDAPKIDYTDNQRAVLQRRAALVGAHRSLQKASLELSLYYRDSEGRPILPTEDLLPQTFPKPEIKKLLQHPSTEIDSLTARYPDTRITQIQLNQLELDQKLSQNQILPKLDFGLTYARDFGANPGTALIQPSNYPTELRVYVNFEVPLLLRSARGKLAAVHAQQEKTSLIRDLTRDRLKTQILDSAQAITAALSRIELIRQEVDLSLKLEAAERRRFISGDSSLLIVNIREQATRDAMNKEIDALSEFFKAKAEYETYTLNPLPSSSLSPS